ncbi:hypothetical protein BJ741DRAFT_608343 [Chytriomyces cf. hyalinus JEL632]|nr:hypothetical protein BJ741DRAFT_608343 [Chytriomyces cf. hyalinus JEL632]
MALPTPTPAQTSACLLVLAIFSSMAGHAAAFDWTLHGPQNSYVSFSATLIVPPMPGKPATGDGTWFYWPGLQTDSRAANYNPIGFGVLQPVLSYGPACYNKGSQPLTRKPYESWYVSNWYVNLQKDPLPGYRGCFSSEMMLVNPGDSLAMSLVLDGTTWLQSVTRQGKECSGGGSASATGCQVLYSLDMLGQGQNRAELVLEHWNKAGPYTNVAFNDITLVTANAEPASSLQFCTERSLLQKYEACSGMVLSDDKKTCTIQQCLFAPPALPSPVVVVTTAAGANATATVPADPAATNTTAASTETGTESDGGFSFAGVGPMAPPADAPPDTTANLLSIKESNPDTGTTSINGTSPNVVWGTTEEGSGVANPPPPAAAPSPSSSTSAQGLGVKGANIPQWVIYAGAGGGAFILLVVGLSVVLYRRRKRAHAPPMPLAMVPPNSGRPSKDSYDNRAHSPRYNSPQRNEHSNFPRGYNENSSHTSPHQQQQRYGYESPVGGGASSPNHRRDRGDAQSDSRQGRSTRNASSSRAAGGRDYSDSHSSNARSGEGRDRTRDYVRSESARRRGDQGSGGSRRAESSSRNGGGRG